MRGMRWGRLALSFLLATEMAVSAIPTPALAEALEEVQDLAEEQVEEAVEETPSDEVLGEIAITPQAGASQTYTLDDERSNEELLAGYAQERIDESLQRGDAELSVQDATESIDGLSVVDYAVYQSLKQQIQEIAAGRSVSTRLSVPFNSIFDEVYTFTADDLGVPIAEGNQITDQAVNAADSLMEEQELAANGRAIVNALLADCPFDLYWFDRSAGVGWGTMWQHEWVDDELVLTTDGSELQFDFKVAQAYAADDDFTIDTSHVDAINAAVDNAQAIVDGAEGSVYERLAAYKEAICERVAYNDDAANETNGVAYGDPWQLIWVFDGDESTNVVCEGYAKAFKYLVDLTEDIDATCYTVTGDMGGNHMWNVVTMDDGKNYLVDVTNCDAGSVGEPDKLFIVAPSSGSIEDGYTFDANGTTVTYAYGDETLSTYDDAVLELSDVAYDGQVEDPNDDPIDLANASCWVEHYYIDVNEHDVAQKLNVSYEEGRTLKEGEDYELVYYQWDYEQDHYVQLDDIPSQIGEYYVSARAISDTCFGETDKQYYRIVDARDLAHGSISLSDYSIVYKADMQFPTVWVYDAMGNELEQDKDYVLVYYQYDSASDEYIELDAAPMQIGYYDVAARAIGSDYSGETGKYGLSICDKYDIGAGIWTAEFEDGNDFSCTTDGLSLPEPVIKRWDSDEQRDIVLTPGEDFEFAGYEGFEGDETPFYPGGYYAVYEGKGTYTGKCEIWFNLVADDEYDLTFAQLRLSDDTYDWTGEAVNLYLEGVYASDGYVGEDDYELAYYDTEGQQLDSAPVDAGTYYVAARATGDDYSGETAKVAFQILAANDIGGDSNWDAWFMGSNDVCYTGAPVELPDVWLEYWNGEEDCWTALAYGTDYKLDHIEDEDGNTVPAAIEIGAYYAVYEGINDFTGTRRVEFHVVDRHDLAYARLRLAVDQIELVNGVAKPEVTVTDVSGKVLTPLTDYVLHYYSSEEDEDGSWYETALPGAPTEIGSFLVCAEAIEGSDYVGTSASYEFEVYDAYDLSTWCWNMSFVDGSNLIYMGKPLELPAARISRYDQDDQYVELAQDQDFELDHVEDAEGETVDVATALSTPGDYYVLYKGITPYYGTRGEWLEVLNGLDIGTYNVFRNSGIETVAWTGDPIETPAIDLYQRDEDGYYTQLTPEQDFSFLRFENEDGEELSSVTDPGVYYAVYEGKDPYTGTLSVWFEVEKETPVDVYDLESGVWHCIGTGDTSFEWTGNDFELPTLNPLIFRFDEDRYRISLEENTDFELSYFENEDEERLSEAPTEPGVYYAVYEGKAPYKGAISCEFAIIDPNDLANGRLALEDDEFVASDSPVALVATVYDYRGNELKNGVDYQLIYVDEDGGESEEAPSAVGEYSVYAKAMGEGYSGRTSRRWFYIVESSGSGGSEDPAGPAVGPVTMEIGTVSDVKVAKNGYWIGTFTAPKTGAYEFKSTGSADTYGYLYADADLTDELVRDDDDGEGSNFLVVQRLSAGQTVYLKAREYSNRAMTCTVSVEECDAYDLSLASVSLEQNEDTVVPEVTVTDVAGTTVSASDYELLYIQYQDAIDGYARVNGTPTQAGYYHVYARAKSGSAYTGKTSSYGFDLTDPFDLSYATISLDHNTLVATGNPVALDVTVTDAHDQTLVEGTDYELAYYMYFHGYSERLREAPSEPGLYWVAIQPAKNSSYMGENSRFFQVVDATNIEAATVTIEQNTYVYDGTAKKPAVTVILDDKTLVEGTDYEVGYYNYVNAGWGYIEIRGKGDYSGSVGREFFIERAEVTDVTGAQPATYTGVAIEQDKNNLVVHAGELTLGQDDYELSYANNTNAGIATLKVTGTGNYQGEVETTFAIEPAAITSVEVLPGENGIVYTGEEVKPELKVMAGDLVLEKTDYQAVYTNNVNKGTASVTVTGLGNFTGEKSATFEIAGASIAGAKVSVADQTYTGLALEPAVTVTLGEATLVKGRDYTVTYGNNTNAGQAQVTITGTGDYSGEIGTTFQIAAADLSSAVVVPARQTYTGEALEPKVTVTLDGRELAEGDFTVTYDNNTNAGTGTATVHGEGNYTGSATGEFIIDRRAITSVDGPSTIQYTGKQVSPQFTVTASGVELAAGDYNVAYEGDLVGPGEVTATITAKGNFEGTLTYKFSIVDEPVDPSSPDSIASKLSDDLENAQAAADAAKEDLEDKQKRYDEAKAAYDEAKAAADSDPDLKRLSEAVNTAKAELKDAEDDRDAKRQAYEAAQAAVTENETAITQAQTDLKSKQDVAEQKATELKNAQTAEQTAKSAYDIASQAVENAQAAIDAEVGDPGTNADHEEWTAVGLFRYIRDNSPANSAAYWDAQCAIDILTSGTNSTGHSYAATEGPAPDGTNASAQANIYQNVSLASRKDAAALDNVSFGLDLVDMFNEYRAKENTSEGTSLSTTVGTNCRQMAISIVQCDASANVWGHTQAYKGLENLSGGYTNPYDGWYDEEKDAYKSYLSQGLSYNQIVDSHFSDVGHYLTIVDMNSSTFADVVGGAKNSSNNTTEISLRSRFTQYPNSVPAASISYAVDDFRSQWFQPYYDAQISAGMKGTTAEVKQQHRQTLADAQATLAEKQAAYEAAQAATKTAQDAKDAADEDVTTAQSALDELVGKRAGFDSAVTSAKEALQAAETTVTQKQEAYDNADAALKAYNADLAAELERLESEMNAAEAALAEAKATKKATDEALATAQAAFDAAHKITDDNVQVTGINDFIYNGEAQTQSGIAVQFRMTANGTTETYVLEKDTDYTVEYSGDTTNAGTVTMTIVGMGDYTGSVERTYNITPATITSVVADDTTYTGAELATNLTVRAGELTLTSDDYDVVEYNNNTNAGTATVTVRGKGNFQGEKTAEFKIDQAALGEAKVSAADQTYTGEPLEPQVTVMLGSKTLEAGVDYDVTFSNHTNIGTATITVVGKGNYAGTATGTFRIKGLSSISLEDQTKTYTGGALAYDAEPTKSGSTGDVTYAYYRDEQCTNEVAAANVKDVGTYYVRATLAADDNYVSAVSNVAKFTVAKAQIASVVSNTKSFVYDGKAKTPAVTVKAGSVAVPASGYTVSYKNNVNAGTATVTVTGKGNYAGSKSATFSIAKAANPMVATAKKQATVKASKVKKKNQKVKISKVATIKGNQGAVTYTLKSVKKAKFTKYFKVAASTGNITVKKKLKKGTYRLTIDVTAAGNANYNAATKTVIVKIKVK